MPGFDLKLDGVCRRYRLGGGQEIHTVRDLTIRTGEAVAVTRPLGSGKSTLLHLVGAMEARRRPGEGRRARPRHRGCGRGAAADAGETHHYLRLGLLRSHSPSLIGVLWRVFSWYPDACMVNNSA
jgi:ABC-type branched-subunit amino acid transport system ATPase component